MRKSIAVLFISFIMICLISIGLSEPNYAVNFLGNVTFGMSANEVRFNLQQSNFSVNDSNWGTTVFGEIGGFEKSAATFNYNVLEQLDSVKYDLKINSDEETTAHDFDIVEETLIERPVPFQMLDRDAAPLCICGNHLLCGIIGFGSRRKFGHMLCLQTFALVNVEHAVIA